MKNFQQSKTALGSHTTLNLVCETKSDADQFFDILWHEVDAFEDQFSRFKTTSELSRVNAMAGQRTDISPRFRDIISHAIKLSYVTDGLFNPLILPALQRSGYVGSWPNPEVGDDKLDFSDREVVPVSELDLGSDWLVMPQASAIDLGGCGKGMLLDELANIIGTKLTGYWLSLGGDITCHGTTADNRPWEIAIDSAKNPGTPVENVTNTGGARLSVATSGTIKRQGTHNGRHWHHIINPITGRPATTDVLTATVTTTRAADADVFAKCLVILGSRMAKNWLRQQPGASALLQLETGALVQLEHLTAS